MLLGNYAVILKNPSRSSGGRAFSGTIAPWDMMGAFYTGNGENVKFSAFPTATQDPYAFILPPKTGGEMSSTTSISGTSGLSGSLVMGGAISASLSGVGAFSSSLGLLSALSATLAGIGSLSAGISASLGLTSTMGGTSSLSANMGMLVPFSANLSGTGALSANLKGMASLSATIYVNQSQATVQQLVDGVWNAQTTDYVEVGSMGEAVQAGGGGGGYTPAQIADAVWDEVLTGATHNVPTSAGRRLRQLGQSVVWDGTARGSGTGDNQIQLDTGAANYDGAYDPTEIAIVAGTGVGQSRMIIDYVGSTRIATVDRNWKVKPDATSEFIIYVNAGREHVNEGLATGGTSSSITLNSSASPIDDAYIGQNVFIRSGTGQDQVARVTDYNGTTKVATIETARADGLWGVIPDTTSGYVMLPYHAVASGGGGGGLTEAQANHLMKLRNGGGGGAVIDGKSIEEFVRKGNAPLVKTIEKLPEEIKSKLDEKISEENNLAEEKLSDIIDSKDKEIEKALGLVNTLSEKTESAIIKMNETTVTIKQNNEKLLYSLEVKELEKEIEKETALLDEKIEKQVQEEISSLDASLEEKIEKETKDLDDKLEKQIQDEIKNLDSKLQ